MRAAAVALVMVIGAVVVLWFGNTLNSWVLGGLVGGFAALLIGIPISVALFLHLSRRHDEKMHAEAAQNLAPESSYFEERVAVYEAEADVYALDADEDEEWYEEDERDYTSQRNLPAPSYSRVPAMRQSQTLMNAELADMPDMALRRNSTSLPSMRRPSAQRQYGYGSGVSRNGAKPTRSQHLTAALHAARLEALQQADEDMDGYGPTTSRKIPTVRPEQSSMRTSGRLEQQSMRQFQSPFPNPNQYRPRKIVDGTSMPAINSRRALPSEGETSASRSSQQYARNSEPRTGQIHQPEPETGQIHDFYPQTGPMRQQPRTGQIVRNPRIEEQHGDPERVSGSLQNPMVRRAPYMYADDPLRQQFAQQLDEPVVRRSSRKLRYEEAED